MCGDLRLCVRRQGSGGYRCRGPGSVFDFQPLCLNKYFGVGARIRRPIINALILFFMFLVQQQRHRKFINQQFKDENILKSHNSDYNSFDIQILKTTHKKRRHNFHTYFCVTLTVSDLFNEVELFLPK